MAGKGGARPGAGRKRNPAKHKSPTEAATARCADRLPQTFDQIEALADGMAQRVEEKWEPAGTITVKAPLRDRDGSPLRDAKGLALVVEQPAFPDKPADELILIERKVVKLGPDFRANEYLANRVMGKPTESLKLGGDDQNPLKIAISVVEVVKPDGADDFADDFADAVPDSDAQAD